MPKKTFPQLADFFAGDDYWDRPFVGNVIRRLREQGHLERGKAGKGASVVTSEGAAKVLICLLMAHRPSHAPRAIQEYGSLPGDGRTLLEALTALIDHKRQSPGTWPDGDRVESFEIFPHTKVASAAVARISYVRPFLADDTAPRPEGREPDWFGGVLGIDAADLSIVWPARCRAVVLSSIARFLTDD